jgi:hypothetical protein
LAPRISQITIAMSIRASLGAPTTKLDIGKSRMVA